MEGRKGREDPRNDDDNLEDSTGLPSSISLPSVGGLGSGPFKGVKQEDKRGN